MAVYQWKDDPARRQSFSDRIATAQPKNGISAQAVAQGAQPDQANPVTGAPAPAASPWGMGAPQQRQPQAQQRATSPFTIPGLQQPKQSSFASLIESARPAREQNVAAAQKSISELLTPQAGPSAEGQRVLSDLDKQQAEQARQVREQAALSGRLATGQAPGDMFRASDRFLAQRADVAGQVAAKDAERADQRRQQGLSALLSMEGLGQQAEESAAQRELQGAQLGLQAQGLAQEAAQFESKQAFDAYALERGISQQEADRAWQSAESEKQRGFQSTESAAERASREKLGFADLSIREKSLAQEASQFTDRLSFDRWATERNLDDRTAERIWNANEAEKGRTFEERILGRQQEFQARESSLDRELNATQFAEKIGLDRQQFGEQVRQFNSRQEFETWAKNLDVSQAEADRVWNAQQSDVQRKWQSGERLSSQEHEILVESLREKADMRKIERNQILNLETLDKQQAFEREIEGQRQGYETLRMREGFSHEEAMAQVEADIAQRLSAQGYTQDQALQAARIEADRINQERDLAFQDKVQFARLAQENEQFWRNFGLDKKRVELQSKQIESEIKTQAERLGMDKAEFEAVMENTEFKKNFETAAILSEVYGDSPEMLQKASELVWDGLYKGSLVSQAEYNMGKLSAKAQTFKDPAAFQAYAKSIGADDGSIAAIIEANTEGGVFGGGKTTTDATGKASSLDPKRNELAEEVSMIAPNGTNQDIQKWVSERGSDEVNINGTKAKVKSIFDTGGRSTGRQLLLNVDGRDIMYDTETGKYSVYKQDRIYNPNGGYSNYYKIVPFDNIKDAYSAWTIDPAKAKG